MQGKRSTDVLVEKERSARLLQEVQAHLLQEVASYHALRTDYLLHTLHCFADTQVGEGGRWGVEGEREGGDGGVSGSWKWPVECVCVYVCMYVCI